tara:strand:+ start:114 stop:311 length:198 start_codon:yes stop_codon:yes gene_type:complete
MSYIRKPKHKLTYTLKAKKWFKLNYKEASFKDYNSDPYYTQHQYGLGFTMNGGKSNKCRYAGLYN